jgi:hypothetical protein
MDFLHNPLIDGQPFRMRTVIDQFSRLSPLVEPRSPSVALMSLKHWMISS